MDRAGPARSDLYPRWIAANAFAEALGLGATFVAVALASPALEAMSGFAGVIVGFVVLVAAGALEATVVALLQYRAMRSSFPVVTRAAWWRATLFGALLAYALGYLPSTLLGAADAAGAEPVAEPAAWLTIVLAAGLGIVAGAILAAFQARVLARGVAGAGRWIPANMAAWALGIPVIFLGMDLAFAAGHPLFMATVIGATLLVAGALVGAVHGRVLVRLAAS